MKIGHFTLSFVDLAVPVSGLDIEIVRTYDSRDKQQRDFGVGWSLDVRQGSYRNNRPPGDGWQLQNGFVACDTALESKSHLTVVRLSDQEVYRFALRLVRGAPRNGGGCSATAAFEYIDGPLPGTTLTILGNDQIFQETPSSNRVLDEDTFATYEPQHVRLTTRDGRIFELNLTDGVTKLEDLNGNHLSITPAGITHSIGKGIVFERDAEGLIERITDPLDRSMSYAYDAAGHLISFMDRAGAVTRFTYDDHRLRDIEDPRGVKPIRNEYDAEGRLVCHVDAFGKVIKLGHERDNLREVVTNRLGASRILEYDARGNVVRETDELGKVTQRVFDGRDNLLNVTDPLGRTTTYTHTANDDLETLTDPLGNVIRYTYDDRGRVLTTTGPRGGVTTSAYDSQGNLTRTTDAVGQVTSFTHDSAGKLLTTTDALDQVTTYEYDAFGNPTKEIDALGHETDSTYNDAGGVLTETRTRTLPDGSTETVVTSFVYDALDRLTTTTNADGSTQSTTYDLLGKVTRRTDPLGRVTTMAYDLMGRPVSTAYPDGTTESQSYDAEGRVLSRVDRAGRTTSFTYNAAGRFLTTTYPEGATTSSTHDDAGQLIASTDARGNTSTYEYDAAGRRTAVIDALGNGQTYAYDSAGNQTATADAQGDITSFAYDALGRRTTTTYPGGTTTQIAYDALGRRVAETDQAGIATRYGYDALGRLTSVTDALDQITSYTYDELGNRLTQTDANGHTTSFECDALGRQTARMLPGGARETKVYNVDGTLASHTDFNGATRTFHYDDARRLIRRAYPGGSDVTFTFTPAGQRATATDARGTTSYAYDGRDRLIEKVDPSGYKLTYAYDAQGNRNSLTATVGAEVYTTTYTHDALNRVATVTDPQGGVTTLGYDADGNQSSLAHPNGITTTYTYDGLDRLTELRSLTSVGEVLQSHRYTLGPAGNRTRIDEHDGTSRHYQYDALYRLTQDRVIDAADSLVYQRDFLYDPVGNRLQQMVTDDGEPTIISSTYDSRGRLEAAGATSYGWDANGNLTSKTDEGVTAYAWDDDNRLTSVMLADGSSIQTAYDVDGNRTRAVLTPANGQPATTDYLIDTSRSLSHVIAEINDEGIESFYTRAGHRLANFWRPASSTRSFYHADGLGTVRLLSDMNGEVTDRYSYSAFGEFLAHQGSDSNPYTFAGEPLDRNSRLLYLRARCYDPETGGFLSRDPWPGWTRDPASLHSYSYAASNPVNRTDPTGYFSLASSLVTLGAMPVLAFLGVGKPSRIAPPTFRRVFSRIIKSPRLGFYKHFDLLIRGNNAHGRFLVVQWIRGFMRNRYDFVELDLHQGKIDVPASFPNWTIDAPDQTPGFPDILPDPEGLLLRDKPGFINGRIPMEPRTKLTIRYDFLVTVYDKATAPTHVGGFTNPWVPAHLAIEPWSFHDEYEVQ
ncbi:MAG: RHS repeat-associated core domain-containing protein [Actinomycetia bacterium]|nr:RHS repeat-associated core domain-containing protein [Actinomycetes bacterium]